MCSPAVALAATAVGALVSAKGAYETSAMNKIGYQEQAAVQRHSAEVDEFRASDALERGQRDVFNVRLKQGQVEGAQRARFAAAGLDLNEGSPLAILMDTRYMGNLDAATAEDNANKEAYVLRESAATSRRNASFLDWRGDQENPRKAYVSSLLGSAGQVASTWYARR